MKNIISLIALTLMLSCCDKDDNKDKAPIDQLPPATQIGANTFGCLLDGKSFLPQGSPMGGPILNCTYQRIDNSDYFYLTARNTKMGITKSISVGADKLQISQGNNYLLKNRLDGNAFGEMFLGDDNLGIYDNYYTSDTHVGGLFITKLDFQNNIVSGTFWFDVEDSNGIVHQIREGRFDMQFTQ